jgi:poly-beta-1,6-N-acetyl-D-glucosamine synthase
VTRYVVITPVRDEEEYLPFTLESMIAQTIRPIEWIIVDDGSSDDTGKIIDDYSQRHRWIRGLHRENRGFRKSGGGVVEAFNVGYTAIATQDWDYIVKLDGDLTFQPDYFEKCFEHFVRDPHLGLGGGVICHVLNGVKATEPHPAFHVRGATKIYRKACWDSIGGFWPAPGWDTLDEVKANMLGWKSRSFPELELLHHRFTGSADGRWGGSVKNGRANYIAGYHPAFMLAKCASRFARRPFSVGPFALAYGYISGFLKKIPQVNDPALISYLRSQQLKKLLGGETIWR